MKLCFPVLLLAALSFSAPASPITWAVESGGNGHSYEIIGGDYYWTALENAQARVYNGVQGHLALIPDLTTQEWLVSAFAADFGPSEGIWIGLYKQLPDTTPSLAGEWTWVSGHTPATYGYANWAPDNPAGDWAAYMDVTGLWYSSGGSYYRRALVEYGADAGEPGETVELGTLLMMATGLGALKLLRNSCSV
jgi:hypothetical protein